MLGKQSEYVSSNIDLIFFTFLYTSFRYGKPFFVSEQAMKPRDEQLEKKMNTVFGPAVTSRIDPKLQEKQK